MNRSEFVIVTMIVLSAAWTALTPWHRRWLQVQDELADRLAQDHPGGSAGVRRRVLVPCGHGVMWWRPDAIVEAVETEPDIGQVAQVCQRFAITERSLQRLLRRRIGLSPRWLIQRRRLHEASERLRSGPGDLAGVAHDLGYADQAHFTRDFRRVTGMTPGVFARRFSGARPPV